MRLRPNAHAHNKAATTNPTRSSSSSSKQARFDDAQMMMMAMMVILCAAAPADDDDTFRVIVARSPCWLVVPLGCVRARFSFFPTLIYATNNKLSVLCVYVCVLCAWKKGASGGWGLSSERGGIKMKTQPFYAQRRIYSSNNNNNKKEKSGYSTTSAKKGYTGDREEEVILCVLCAL